MSFSYLQFESYLPTDILRKGMDYYDEGMVANLVSDDNIWVADVYGSDQYYVVVKLEHEEVTEWSCDCPYDWGPTCKHVAAVLYAIREAKEQGENSASGKKKKSKDSIQLILDQLSQQELHKILAYFAQRNSEVRSYLLSRYSELLPLTDKKDYVQLVKTYIQSVSADKYGFLSYSAASQLGHKMYDLIDEATAESMSTIYLCEAALDQMVLLMDNADDSDGMLGMAMNKAFNRMEAVVLSTKDKDDKIARHVFNWAMDNDSSSMWEEVGDYEFSIKQLALRAICSRKDAQQFRAALDQYISLKETKEYSRYSIEIALKLKYKLLKTWFKEEAETFLNYHLHVSDFREQALKQALEEENYDYAIQLAKEGIALATDSNYHGLVRKWNEWLIRITEASGDQESLIDLYEEDYLANGKIESYRNLKKLLPKAAFDERVSAMIQAIEQSYARFTRPMFKTKVAKILIEEGRYEALIDMIEEVPDLHLLDEYFTLLSPLFPKKYIDLYAQELNKYMETLANNRKDYKFCCTYLNKMVHMGAKEEATFLAQQWKKNFVRRRALHEELSKLDWLKK